MEVTPLNHRARWTTSEFNQLIREINNGYSFDKIATIHERTVGAIKYKLIRWAIDMAEEDQSLSMEQLCKITKLNRDDLMYGFEKLKFDYEYLINNENTEEKEEEDDDYEPEDDENEENNDDLMISVLRGMNSKINVITFLALVLSLELGIRYGIHYWKKS
jgi:hypothetical protein